MAAPGWYPDPTGRFELRWFDGSAWSPSVSRGGQQYHDELNAPAAPIPPQGAFGPPPGFGSSPIPSSMEPALAPRSRTGLWVAVALVAIVAVVVGVVIAARSSDDAASAGTESTAVVRGDTTPATTPASDAGAGLNGSPVQVTGDALVPYDDPGNDLAVGTPAPVLVGFDLDGNPITIDAATDGPYMVVFLAHWCPHCNREIPRLIDWLNQGGVPKDLKVVGVATAVAESAPNYPPVAWLQAKEWPWPAMLDEYQGEGAAGVAATAFGATGWPYIVIIGADGLVKARAAGEMEIDQIQAMVDAALAS